MKQRRHSSNKLSATFAVSILSLALAGITCGTFAWFAYATRADVAPFQGVTIGYGELEAGIISEVDLPDAEQYELRKDDSNPDEVIYWFTSREVKASTLGYVLDANGYATDKIFPVTTLEYSNDTDFNLYSSPKPYSFGEETLAEKESYIYLPLVFRYADILEDDVYYDDENIYLSEMDLKVLDTGSHISESLRIHSSNRYDNTHLINPSQISDGETAVGGPLNLNRDSYYDVEKHSDGELYERVYGQVHDGYTYRTPVDSPEYPAANVTTFDANHQSGVYILDTYEPYYAQYDGYRDFVNKQQNVTTTRVSDNHYAYLDLTIFVEGWDRSVIDSEYGMNFSLDLKFEAE